MDKETILKGMSNVWNGGVYTCQGIMNAIVVMAMSNAFCQFTLTDLKNDKNKKLISAYGTQRVVKMVFYVNSLDCVCDNQKLCY